VKAAQVCREVCHGLGIKAWRMRVIHFAAWKRNKNSDLVNVGGVQLR